MGKNNLGRCLVVSEVIVPKRLPIYTNIKIEDKITGKLEEFVGLLEFI